MKSDVALLVIDVQNGLFQEADPIYDGHGLLERISGLIQKARACDTPVIYVQHNEGAGEPLETNSPGWSIHPMLTPVDGDIIIQKHTCDSFHETDLQSKLEMLGIRKVVIAGLQTDYCINATCRRASDLGYHVTVVKDCHSTTNQVNQSAKQIIAHYNDCFRSFGDNIEASNIEFH
jgi:nicotinamidase-related amidase